MESLYLQQEESVREEDVFAVTGITGQVGSAVARTLLEGGRRVRGVVRNRDKAAAWEQQGCELVGADINSDANSDALAQAFTGVEGVFAMLPPLFDPSPGFPEARRLVANLRKALAAAGPLKIMCLSTIGAQATQTSLLTQLQILEQELSTLPLPIAFLRAAWFMENSAWDVAPARDTGVVPSFLQPLDKSVPMVAVADVGRRAAELLLETWQGRRIVELEGPQRVSPNDLAASFGRLLNREVRAQPVPRESWETLFKAQGMKNPTPRIRMLDGLNEGWIDFEGRTEKGSVPLDEALRSLIERAA